MYMETGHCKLVKESGKDIFTMYTMYTLKFIVYTSKIYSLTESNRELCFLRVGQLLIFLQYIVNVLFESKVIVSLGSYVPDA